MTITSVFAPITKTVEQDDGTVIVYGKATDGALDGDSQRCDPAWLAEAMPAWYTTGGNIREQHDPHRAVGKAIDHEDSGDGSHYVTAHIVDPVAVLKTKAGVFTGFSIGISRPKVSKSADAPNGIIDGGNIVELSLCDRPSNPGCLITLVKSATPGMEVNASDFDADRLLVRCEELIVKEHPNGGDGGDETMRVTLADALPPDQAAKLAAKGDAAPLQPTVPTPILPPAEEPPAAGKSAEGAATPTDPGSADKADKAFDADAAKALVAAVLTKDPGDASTMAGPPDEVVAATAISLIAGLIQSEAQDMVDDPDEDGDIRCLLEAVAALRWFIRSERAEGGAGGFTDSAPYYYAAHRDPIPVAKAETAKTATATTLDPTVVVVPDATPEPVATKTVDADAGKAMEVHEPGIDVDALVKALSETLSKSDSPLTTMFTSIVQASTEATVKSVSDLMDRMAQVEQMAIPGGPAVRRTEVEKAKARARDLASEVRRFQSLADHTADHDLRQGYAAKVATLETELRALTH